MSQSTNAFIDQQIDEVTNNLINEVRQNIENLRVSNEKRISDIVDKEIKQTVLVIKQTVRESSEILKSSNLEQEVARMTQVFKAFQACQSGKNLKNLDSILKLGKGHPTYDVFINQNPLEDAYNCYVFEGVSGPLDMLLEHDIQYQQTEKECLLEQIEFDLDNYNNSTQDMNEINRLQNLKSRLNKLTSEEIEIQSQSQNHLDNFKGTSDENYSMPTSMQSAYQKSLKPTVTDDNDKKEVSLEQDLDLASENNKPKNNKNTMTFR